MKNTRPQKISPQVWCASVQRTLTPLVVARWIEIARRQKLAREFAAQNKSH